MNYYDVGVIVFAALSYGVGAYQIIKGKLKPSFFSRIVWVFLSLNSFVGSYLANVGTSSVLLAGSFFFGSLIICIGSYFSGTREFGKTEKVSLALLFVSIVLWIIIKNPIVSVVVTLIAHAIGGIPTYKKVINDPTTETPEFWSLFFIASVLSFLGLETKSSFSDILIPVYFILFDGGMTALSLTGRLLKNKFYKKVN